MTYYDKDNEPVMLTCRVPKQDAERLNRVAQEKGTTRSELLRRAIARIIRKVA